MLILSRRIGEKIIIGNDITIEIIDFDEYKARIAITAPNDVLIDHPKKTLIGKLVDRITK